MGRKSAKRRAYEWIYTNIVQINQYLEKLPKKYKVSTLSPEEINNMLRSYFQECYHGCECTFATCNDLKFHLVAASQSLMFDNGTYWRDALVENSILYYEGHCICASVMDGKKRVPANKYDVGLLATGTDLCDFLFKGIARNRFKYKYIINLDGCTEELWGDNSDVVEKFFSQLGGIVKERKRVSARKGVLHTRYYVEARYGTYTYEVWRYTLMTEFKPQV